MNKGHIYAVVAVVLALAMVAQPTAAYATPQDVQLAEHTTDAEFSNAAVLQNMQVSGDTVTLGEGTTSHFEGFEDGNIDGWTAYNDNPYILSSSSSPTWPSSSNYAMLYQPGGQDWENVVLYDGFYTDQQTGTMAMEGYINVNDVDSTNPQGQFRLFNPDTGEYYFLTMVDAAGGDDFKLGYGTGNNANYLTGGFGDYEAGGYIKIRIEYDYDVNTLRGYIYKLGSDTPFASASANTAYTNPYAFGVSALGNGQDWIDVDSLTMESGVPQSATYKSAAYNVDGPTGTEVEISELSGGDATISVQDGNGNTLGSKTVSSPGTYFVDADPTQQVGSQAHVQVEATDTGSAGDLAFTMPRESIWFENDPPSASNTAPDGVTVYTNTPQLSADLTDPQFNEIQGDSVNAEWYVDGTHVATTGPYTSAQTISYEPAALSEGQHEWHVEVIDKYGGEYTSDINDAPETVTIDHKAPIVYDSTASPSGNETTPYSAETLSIDVADYDFAHDGDTLTVGWYVDGTFVHETTGVNQNQTVEYTTSELGEGQHSWYVKVGDSWGDTTQSQTFEYFISHVAPEVSNPSIDGVSHYETNELAVDVDDQDFYADGDTLEVGFYVDGALVNTQTITSAQRVSYNAGPYADGNYDWHVEVTDAYGYKTTTDTWSLDIQHDDPAIDNPTIDGTTVYETNTLGVDLSDADFNRDGDTVTVGIYVDGAKVNEQTIGANQTVTYDAGPYNDGSHTWHVEAADNHGYLTVSPTWDLNIQHDKPAVTNPSIDGVTRYEENTLSVDVNDYDFTQDGDSVDVGLYVEGTLNKTQTLTSNGTAAFDVGPYADGNYTWHIEAVDDHGYTTVTPTWDLNVTHKEPLADPASISPTGTINYENAELTVDVTDPDFPIDGDTVDIEWIVDGTTVQVDEITANGTYTHETVALPDGQHKWKVNLYDDYGYVTGLTNETFTVEHFPTQIDNATMTPTGVIKQQKPTFSVDVADPDFAMDGDSVDMGLYVNETDMDPYLVGVDTLYQNRTASVTPDAAISGDASYYWRAVDDYGYDVNSSTAYIEAPNSLFLHDVTPPYDSLNQTAALSVVTGSSEDTVDLDTDTDGSIEFGDLPAGEQYVFSMTADGYYQRAVYVDELYSRNVIFMIPEEREVVSLRVIVQDATGKFTENPILNIETVINTSKVDNMPDNGPQWVVVGGDRLGVNREQLVTLRKDGRYRFTVRNEQGDSRTMGSYTAKDSSTINLNLGKIEYPATNETGFMTQAYVNQSDGDGGSATFAYNDPDDQTEWVNATMKIRGTGEVIGTNEYQAGTFGEAVFTFNVSEDTFNNRDIVVEWNAGHDGETVGGSRMISGQSYVQDMPIDTLYLKIMYAGVIIMLAFVTGAMMGPAATFIVVGVGALLAVVLGIIPLLGGGAGVLAIAMGVVMTKYNETVQPQ